MSDLGNAAQARRFYLHISSGGNLKPHDIARMVETIEGLEAKLVQVELDRDAAREDGFLAGIGAAKKTVQDTFPGTLYASNRTRCIDAMDALSPAPKTTRVLEAALELMPYLKWTMSPESPGYHPTLPSAVSRLEVAIAAQAAEA